MTESRDIILCPGQGAQAVSMGKAWVESSAAARAVFDEADQVLGDELGERLSQYCFEGPGERLTQTDVSQPAIYACSVASYQGLLESDAIGDITSAAGLSLGEYTALHLAGAFSFADGLRLVALRGKVMQEACDEHPSSMVVLIGADETQAAEVCEKAAQGQVLVPANFNAPGQIVLSGNTEACERAGQVASELGVKSTKLTVAGAFHSPLMESAAQKMKEALAEINFQPLKIPVWSNVTAQPHDSENSELLRQRLVEQIVSPVKWAQTCQGLVSESGFSYHELAPGTVLRGLMRRIDRTTKVISHDEP
ncbi:MAG: ACP S-malonyltransferase [Planctomycetota bacterium]|nr:ACP S-malonyltransferase [Planctomycetota bacterium]